MAERVNIKTVTVPAGTPASNPLFQALDFRQGHAEQVEIRIPPGPSGLVGVALLRSGRRELPRDTDEWLITDAEPVIWPLQGYGTSESWAVIAYNTDIYEHTFQIRMLFNEIRATSPKTPEPVEVVPLSESTEEEQDFPEFLSEPEAVTE